MPTTLMLHGRSVKTVYELLGTRENDLTYSLGWCLSHSDALCNTLVRNLFPSAGLKPPTEILLQDHKGDGGYTDIEISGPDYKIIVEAKRGWLLPARYQLHRYRNRLKGFKHRCFVSLSEALKSYAVQELPTRVDGIPVNHFNWQSVMGWCKTATYSHVEGRMLLEFAKYLARATPMRNPRDAMVWVVAIANNSPLGASISWCDIVNKKRIYFHPQSGRPPVNFMGFRYDGKLQSIHHVERWEVSRHLHEIVPELKPKSRIPHYVYHLGDPIFPMKNVRTGKIYRSGRVWAMLDLLLTCETISEARDKTKERLNDEDLEEEY